MTQQLRSVRSGVGTYVRLLLEGLQESSLQMAVATWGTELDPDSFPGTEWIDLGRPPRFDPTPGAFLTLGRRLAKRVDLGAYRLVHFLDAREAWSSLRNPPNPRPKCIGTVHDDYALHAPPGVFGHFGRAGDPLRRWAYYRWLRRLEQRCYPAFDLLMSNAEATSQSLIEGYGIPSERCSTVPLTVSEASRHVHPVALSGQPTLLFAGGNFYRKGLDILIRSIALLRSEFPGLRLHVAGRDPLQRKLERLARRLAVREQVIFHGRVPPSQIEGFLNSTDIFVMPSRREALGLVYLEAFRARVPVIAGSRGGVAELIEDGKNGLLVAPEQPASLAEAILRISREPQLRRKLIDGGRRCLEARSPARLIEVTRQAYERMLASDS